MIKVQAIMPVISKPGGEPEGHNDERTLMSAEHIAWPENIFYNIDYRFTIIYMMV